MNLSNCRRNRPRWRLCQARTAHLTLTWMQKCRLPYEIYILAHSYFILDAQGKASLKLNILFFIVEFKLICYFFIIIIKIILIHIFI